MAGGWGASLERHSELIRQYCLAGPVIPVVEIDDPTLAKPLGEALLRGGVTVVEITLRTPAALKAIEVLATLEDLIVGAGTLLKFSDMADAKEAGANFGVSPGASAELIEASHVENFPFLPGATTPSEVMSLLNHGFEVQKFFPAEMAGGIAMLKGLAGPFKTVRFCPTGGITGSNSADYLALTNVVCVGGSWVASRELIAKNAWSKIEENARFSRSLTS